MYFDAVLNKNLQPIFNGTPEQVKKWIEERIEDDEEVQTSVVCLGTTVTMTSAQNYIAT